MLLFCTNLRDLEKYTTAGVLQLLTLTFLCFFLFKDERRWKFGVCPKIENTNDVWGEKGMLGRPGLYTEVCRSPAPHSCSFPVCTDAPCTLPVATKMFLTILWESELCWGHCCDMWKMVTPQGQVWYNKPVHTATVWSVSFIQTNLGIASNTLHQQSRTIFPHTDMTPASPWTWQVVGTATASAQHHSDLYRVPGFLTCARENQLGNTRILQKLKKNPLCLQASWTIPLAFEPHRGRTSRIKTGLYSCRQVSLLRVSAPPCFPVAAHQCLSGMNIPSTWIWSSGKNKPVAQQGGAGTYCWMRL